MLNEMTPKNQTNGESNSVSPHAVLPLDSLRRQLNQTIIGKPDVVDLVIACLLARGHLLFDDLPGLGKTTLAKGIAHSIDGRFARIQCTPDLMPSDITGFSVFDSKTHTFEFRRGPVFADLLLADEINRATPRTQSALFEAMAERQVTADNQTLQLTPSFIVIATQNPVESHGAYPLPEAQLDRFTMKLSIGYPMRSAEVHLLGNSIQRQSEKTKLDPVLNLEQLEAIQDEVACVEVCEFIREYLVDLGTATRNHSDVVLGVSPRGLILWQRAAQAWAYMQNRNFVIPEDIQVVAQPVLRLRIPGNIEKCDFIIQEVLKSVPVPNETNARGK